MTAGYAILLDFEATCDDVDPPSPQEIIEFPSVLLRLEDRVVIDEFATFVRPVHHPTLRPFCTSLTSITQADVDPAPTFPDALAAWQAWAARHALTVDNAVVATCGDWDLKTMWPEQLRASGTADTPALFTRWMNVKVPFRRLFPTVKANLVTMLDALDLPLVGRHHRGIDDCRNLAAIVAALLDRGVPLTPTSPR
jgi:inhibitor of KinA sporulation pathway (predicted exonuclease)